MSSASSVAFGRVGDGSPLDLHLDEMDAIGRTCARIQKNARRPRTDQLNRAFSFSSTAAYSGWPGPQNAHPVPGPSPTSASGM